MRSTLAALAVGVVAVDCSAQPPEAPASGFQIAVAPLSLAGVTDASYALTITNAHGDVVWSKADLRSSALGSGGGDIGYVAPCDASSNPHTIALTPTGLWTADGPVAASDWQSPGTVSQEATCLADGDAPVRFDLTIARRGGQGFFDTSVEFDDIFCSAKVDCRDDLLTDATSGARGETAVIAFACTTGADQPTWLHMTDAHLTCADGSTTWVSPAGTDGQPGNMGAKRPALFQTAVYWGHEDAGSGDACYWNLALGLAHPGRGCTLEVSATATSSALADGALPDGAVYPVVHWKLPVTDDVEGAPVCGAHALDAGDGVVATDYVQGTGGAFDTSLACTPTPAIESPPRVLCGEVPATVAGTVGGAGEQVAVSTTLDGISVAIGDQRSGVYTLPDGFAVDGCCMNPCCSE